MRKIVLAALLAGGGIAAVPAYAATYEGYTVCSAAVSDNCIERYAVPLADRGHMGMAHHHAAARPAA